MNGHELPAEFQVHSYDNYSPWVKDLVQNLPSILKLKKGLIKKVVTLQASAMEFDGDGAKECQTFANNTSKAFQSTQTTMAALLKKATSPMRKSSTAEEKSKEVAMFIGFDFLLNGLCKLEPAPDYIKEGAWVADRDKLSELLSRWLGSTLVHFSS